jgi:hypothetical protein
MKTNAFTRRARRNSLIAVSLITVSPFASANTPWVGTANYQAAPGATGDEGVVVGPFDTYDFGAGIAVIKPAGVITTGTKFSGSFQTYVVSHQLGSVGINTPQLDNSGGTNFVGTGNGYELTLVANFTGEYTNISSSGWNFKIDNGGTANLYFDSASPDYKFANDTGFKDGVSILSGAISGGDGTILLPGVVGIGGEQVTLDFSGIFGSYNTNVYEPDTIGGGSALFSIQTKALFGQRTPVLDEVWAGAKQVNGITASNLGELAELDGKLNLTAVPVPAAAWMFLTGLLGFLGIRKRKTVIA